MKAIKITLAIFLILGGLVSLMSFFQQIKSYETPELLGHLIAVVLIFWGAYALLKPSKEKL